jgi:hypothetical protein
LENCLQVFALGFDVVGRPDLLNHIPNTGADRRCLQHVHNDPLDGLENKPMCDEPVRFHIQLGFLFCQ